MPILPGPPEVEVILRRSARATRFSLRVSRVDGKVTLSLPLRAREAEAMEFARAQEGWLRNALAKLPQTEGVGIGAEIPVEGRLLRLTTGPGRSLRIEDGTLWVPGDPAQAAARVQAWLRTLARDRLVAASDRYANQIGRKVAKVTLRDTRSRWGSCTHDGRLMFSWRLAMAPPEVLDYVAAHEVAHLAHMDHSPAFWAATARLMPDYARHRTWLRAHGHELLAWRFRDEDGGDQGADHPGD